MVEVRCKVFQFILTCSIILNASCAENETKGAITTVDAFLKKQIEAIDNATSEATDIITLVQQPTSIICNHTNTDAIKLFKKAEGFLYLLSANELLAIDVDENNDAKLHFVGTLLQVEDSIQEVQIEHWQKMIVIVLRLASSLHVYLTKEDFRVAHNLEPIQKINTNSASDRFVLFKKDKELLLVTYGIKSESENELIFYKWKTSFFSKESQESVDLPNKSNLFVFNENINEPLIVSIGFYKNTTRVIILKLNPATNRWSKLQSLHFKQDYIEYYVVDGQLYLIGCSTNTFCAIYKWTRSQFRRYQKINNNIFEKLKNVESRHDIIITEDFKKQLAFHSAYDIVTSQPGLMISPENVVDYAIYKSPISRRLFFVEFMFNGKSSLAINFHKITVSKAREVNERANSRHKDARKCLQDLKATLKSRIPLIQSSHQHAEKLSAQDSRLVMDKKKYFKSPQLHVQRSNVTRLKMPLELKTTAISLQDRVIATNIKVQESRNALRKSQNNVEGRTDDKPFEQMDTIVVQNLVHKGSSSIFKDLLLKSQSVYTFTDQPMLRNVAAKKLTVQSNLINGINLKQLLNATTTRQVSGTKVFKSVQVADLSVQETVNNVPLRFLEPSSDQKPLELRDGFEFQGNINVRHLVVVAGLNGINVTKVMEDVFLNGERSVIRGNLIIKNAATVNQLTTQRIMGIPTNELMTTSTDQIISTNIFINTFHATTLAIKKLNEENLGQVVALINDHNIIEVPTQFETIHIIKNLHINDNEDGDNLSATIGNIKREVIGTQQSDLMQIYDGRVIIRGSLVIKEAQMNSPKSRIVVNAKDVPQDIPANYWMKSIKQDIRSESFKIENPKVRSGSLVAKWLNGHPTRDFVMLDTPPPQGKVNLRFEKAKVDGDVLPLSISIPSLLSHVNRTAVPRRGHPIVVDSEVDFRETLTVRNADFTFINDKLVKEFVSNGQQLVEFTAPKTIRELRADELHVLGSISFDTFNSVNVQNFVGEALRIDRPIEIESIKLETFNVNTMTTEFFEDHQFNEFISSLEKQFRGGETSALKSLKIVGNVEFLSNIFLNTINDETQFNEFLSMLALKNEVLIGIGGKKSFQQNVIVDHIETKLINGFPTERLLHYSLSRNEKQTFTEEFFVKQLTTRDLRVKLLNNIQWNQFVDKKRTHLPLKMNLNIGELATKHLVTSSSLFDINRMMEIIHFPKRSMWNTISVTRQVEMPVKKSSYLDRLLTLAVYKNGAPQVITGDIQVNSEKVYIGKLAKPDGIIVAKGNPIDVHSLFSDSVKNQSNSIQVISGINTFLMPIYVDTLTMEPGAYYGSNEINGIEILILNNTIVRPNDIIVKQKNFAYLHADEIILKGRLNGVPLESVIAIMNSGVTLPTLKINQLTVDHLKVYTFSNYSLAYFLLNRMRKHYGSDQEVTGFITMESLELLNDTILTSINGVSVDDAVFSQSDQLQDITGHKSVYGTITLKGPSSVRTINGYDFVDFMRNCVMRGQKHTAEYLELPAIEMKKGLVAKHSINGHHIDDLLASNAHIPKVNDLLNLMGNVNQEIEKLNNEEKIQAARKNRLLYVDYDPDVQISYVGARDSRDNRPCAEKVIVPTKYKTVIVRENEDTEMIAELPSAKLKVLPNLQCRQGSLTSKRLSVWWSYKSDPNTNHSREMEFHNEVSDVKFVESKRGKILMILTMQNHTDHTSNVAVLILAKPENEDEDWFEAQPKLLGLNYHTHTALVETAQHQFLVVSSFDEASPSDYVVILQFDPSTNTFVESQKRLTGEKFNIILSVNVLPKSKVLKTRTFLIFASEGGKTLFIYRLKDDTKDFVFVRKIPFESEIIEVVVMYITEAPYFIVSLQTGNFCLFEWRGIESWKVKQCGHFANINRIKSYEFLKRQHLFLTSSLNSGTALTVQRQGDRF